MNVCGNIKSMLDSSTLINSINGNRAYLMGIAMIFVVIYHAFCWIYNPIGHLNVGYCGVDIFLFLSGMGLSYSFEKNDIKTFYKNRFWRIYPLYFIAVSIAYALCHDRWNFTTYVANLTTAGYYLNGGVSSFDWYINALVTLYICFPLFYYYSKTRYVGLSLLTIAVFIYGVIYYHHISYWYDCLISRLPIFLYGVMFPKCYKSSNVVALIGLAVFIPCRIFSSKSLTTSFLVIPMIIFFLGIMTLIPKIIKGAIEFCGKYSLEIYLANILIPRVFDILNLNVVQKAMLYVTWEIIVAYLFILISRCIYALRNNIRYKTTD